MLEILKTRSGELQTGAALVTAVFALIALVVAVIQIFSSNASAAQNRAQEAYRDYLNLCIEHPELSSYLA